MCVCLLADVCCLCAWCRCTAHMCAAWECLCAVCVLCMCVCYVCVCELCVCMHGVDAQHICMRRGSVCVCVCVYVCYACVHLLVDTCCLCAWCRYTALMCVAWECVCVCVLCVCACWWTRAVCVHGVDAQRIYVWRGSVCVCVVMGHGVGAWGPRWAGGCRWELPTGALLGWRLCPTSARILRLDSARCPAGINHGTKSLDQEPRRCHAHPSSPSPVGKQYMSALSP